MLKSFVQILLLFFYAIHLQAQSSDLSVGETDSLQQLPKAYLDDLSAKADQLQQKIYSKSGKAIQQFIKEENRIKRKLAKTDSLKAKAIFGNTEEQYQHLNNRLQNGGGAKQYIPTLDTLATSLKFLQQNPQLLSSVKNSDTKLKDALAKVNGLENQLQKADELKKWMRERRQYLKEQLQNLGFAKELKKINKQVFYYTGQLNEYKELLKDHKKAERKALEILSKTKLFQNFMRKNSMLASLFRMPGDPNDPLAQSNLAGLQTRAQVTNLIQQQISTGGPNAQQQFSQNMQQAQSQISELKNKISEAGFGASDAEIPDGFKPNNQKTKGFLQRIEIGTNIQSQKSNSYFPVSSDLGLSLGYKLNDKSVMGIGGSYRMGWGKNIRHINITHQGIGLRSFIDWKIKGSFWFSGGYESNYQNEFRNIEELKNLNAWQQSGLIGLSKVIFLKTKFFKKTKLQLLWDFLSYQQVPRTQPLLFRIGYSLK